MAPRSYDKVKPTYIPYWLVQLRVEVAASGAQVGTRVAVTRPDPVSKRSHIAWETQWASVRAPYSRIAVYPPELTDMQVCATKRFLSADVAALRPGELVGIGEGLGWLKPITSPGMLGPDTRVVPFTVPPGDARNHVTTWVRRQEQAAAEDWYRASFGGDEVRGVDLRVQVSHVVTYPVYVPAYVFSNTLPPSFLERVIAGVRHGPPAALTVEGRKMHTLVSGAASGVVAGSRVYDPVKVGWMAATASQAALWLTGLSLVLAPSVSVLLTAGVALAAAAAARHAPQLRQGAESASSYARSTLPSFARQLASRVLGPGLASRLGVGSAPGRQGDPPRGAAGGADDGRAHTRMEDETVRPYSRTAYARAQEQHTREQARQQRPGGFPGFGGFQGFGPGGAGFDFPGGFGFPPPGGDGGRGGGGSRTRGQEANWQQGPHPTPPPHGAADPKGYYAALGLSPGPKTTQQEIQDAFRAKALQNHPDRVTDPEAKQDATAKFQRLSEAYHVLRNPNKRATYDATGHA